MKFLSAILICCVVACSKQRSTSLANTRWQLVSVQVGKDSRLSDLDKVLVNAYRQSTNIALFEFTSNTTVVFTSKKHIFQPAVPKTLPANGTLYYRLVDRQIYFIDSIHAFVDTLQVREHTSYSLVLHRQDGIDYHLVKK